MWQQASDWALRRLVKALLKRHLKHVLATELDVEQLRISLGRGALELRDVLVSPEWLKEHAPPGLEVVSGYIGRLAFDLAVTSLTCTVTLEDVLVTVRPSDHALSNISSACDADPEVSSADLLRTSGGSASASRSGIDDGLRLVAAGVETLLQRMTVTLNRLSVRFEDSSASRCDGACLTFGQLCYGATAAVPEQEQQQDSRIASTARRLCVMDLCLVIGENSKPVLAPVSGEVVVNVNWPLDQLARHPPHVLVTASLNAIQLQLLPLDITALLNLARSYATTATCQQQQPMESSLDINGLATLACQHQAGSPAPRQTGPPASPSFFMEDLMLPGCEGLVQDALLESAASMTGQEQMDEYFDASSLLGSLQEAFSSAMAGSATSALNMPGAAGSAVDGNLNSGADIFAMHDLAASIRQEGGTQVAQGKSWSMSLCVPSLNLSLLYPEPSDTHLSFNSCLVLELLDITVIALAEPDDACTSLEGISNSSSLSLTVKQLEVAEHLPFPSTSTASSSVSGRNAWVPAEEMAQVLAVLPCTQHVRWPKPTYAGDYPLPDNAGMLNIEDTLTKLSGLSKATMRHSVAASKCTANVFEIPTRREDASALPRMQIVPVLRCGGSTGAALVAHFSKLEGLSKAEPAGATVTIMLQPISVWCTLPLLGHLQSFVTAAALPCVVPPSHLAATVVHSHPSGKAAVTAAIEAILQHQQESRNSASNEQTERTTFGYFRVSVYLTAACIVVAVPPSGALDPGGMLKYFALDVQSSCSQLLSSMSSRMGRQQPKALIASLRESGMEPTVTLQHKSCSDSIPKAVAQCAWTCAMCFGSCTMHAVAESASQIQPGDSLLGPVLTAAQVASLQGGAAPECPGLAIQFQWQELGVRPQCKLLDELWATAESGCQAQMADVQDQLTAGAGLLVVVNSKAALALNVEQNLVAAAASLADGLLQLSAAPPVDTVTQAVLVLELEVQCTLGAPRTPHFCVTAHSMSIVACSGIAGVAGASALVVAVRGLELTRHESPGHSAVILHSGGAQGSDVPGTPAAQCSMVYRPTGDACQLCSNGRYVLPCRGRISVHTSGLTIQFSEIGQLAWLSDLRSFTAGNPSTSTDLGMAPTVADHGSATTPEVLSSTLDWAVRLSGSAVRYDPQDTSQAAAILRVGSVTWQSFTAQQDCCIRAHRIALLVAEAAVTRTKNSSNKAVDAASPSAPFTAASFHQVAAEPEITVQLPAAAQRVATELQQAGQKQPAAVSEVVITNKGLEVMLSRHTLLLLQRVVQQISTSSGRSTVTQPETSHLRHSGAPVCTGSLAVSGATHKSLAVNVMQDVHQSAYASPPRQVEHPAEASVFLDGGWYDPVLASADCPYVMSPAGSPPAMVEGFMQNFAGRPAASEDQGTWYDASVGLDVREEYLVVQGSGEDRVASFGSPDYDCRTLPPISPLPERRIRLVDLSITVTLADTFATVLLPDEGSDDDWEVSEEGVQPCPDPWCRRSQSQGLSPSAAAAKVVPCGEEEVVPLSALVQARLGGVCLQLDSFADQQEESSVPAPRVRYALVVRMLEVRDSFQPRQGSSTASAATAAATGWSELRRMLGYHASMQHIRRPRSCMLQLVVEGHCSDLEAELEYRVQAQLLPLLLNLDQAALTFLQQFFAPASGDTAVGVGTSHAMADVPGNLVQPAASGEPFVQRCEVQPFTLTINYHPHRVDLAALRSGQLSEVLNLVPWGGVSLQFRHLRLFGMQGVTGVGTAVASAYVEDIARFQAHRFVGGIAPIKGICRVSSAAAQLLSIPKQQLYAHSSGGTSGSLSLSALTDADFRRQMQRGLAGFVRAVALEALNLGATVAAGAEVALTGEASASHTAGVKQALRQASAQLLSSSSGPRTAASAAATAVRTALLGARNTLDRQHTMERRLNS